MGKGERRQGGWVVVVMVENKQERRNLGEFLRSCLFLENYPLALDELDSF